MGAHNLALIIASPDETGSGCGTLFRNGNLFIQTDAVGRRDDRVLSEDVIRAIKRLNLMREFAPAGEEIVVPLTEEGGFKPA